MLLVIFIVAIGLVGLLFYKRPLKIDRGDLAPQLPPRPPGPPDAPGS